MQATLRWKLKFTWNSKYDAGLSGKQITNLHLISRASLVKSDIRELITDLQRVA